MKLFVNDKPVSVIEWSGPINSADFDTIYNGSDDLVSKYLKGNVLIEKASTLQIDRLLKLLETKKLKKLTSVTLAVTNYRLIKEYIKDQYEIIKASGGLVVKGDKILMIYRLKKWDLPKGKLKKKEDPKVGAKREVEEE
ncbi:MAG TPA: NUDIX domain-containing protein [Cytophagaceae bacterium]